MENVTPEQFSTFLYVLFLLFAALLTIDKVIEMGKKWKGPSRDVERKLANDRAKLDEHDDAIKVLKDGNRVACNALLALLDHALHNGNSDQMQEAHDDIIAYLTGKK